MSSIKKGRRKEWVRPVQGRPVKTQKGGKSWGSSERAPDDIWYSSELRQTDCLKNEMNDTTKPISLNKCKMVTSPAYCGVALTNVVQSVSPLKTWPTLRIMLQMSSTLTTALNNTCQSTRSQSAISLWLVKFWHAKYIREFVFSKLRRNINVFLK